MSTFNEHLSDWHKAIESEFQATESNDPEAIRNVLRQRVLASTLELTDSLIQLAKFSESDTVRLAATKYLIELGLGTKATDHEGEDSIATVIKALTANSTE